MDGVLDTIADLASGPRAEIALRLIEHAIERIEEAYEAIDDSDGHVGTLLDHARDIHLAAARVVRPEPIAFARNLFKRETEDEFNLFGCT